MNRTTFADILGGIDRQQEKKLQAKLPEWAGVPGITVPSRLSLEQCSSTLAATCKSSIVNELGVKSVTDITGGMGVDSWAFSTVADKVDYYERDSALCSAAEGNFKALGAGNITVHNETVGPATVLPSCDLVYADPARRDEGNDARKVFRLEDCTPDITALLPHLWEAAGRILLKLSPMADISVLEEHFGDTLSQVHIIGIKGECKEILCLLEKQHNGGYTITVQDLHTGGRLSFRPDEEADAQPVYAAPAEGQFLFEPSPVLMKSGCFKLLCQRYGLRKFAPSTHLYSCGSCPDGLAGLGKAPVIKEILPFNNESLKKAGKAWPRCEVTARNLPLSSEALRQKMGVKSGDSAHIYACTVLQARCLIIT